MSTTAARRNDSGSLVPLGASGLLDPLPLSPRAADCSECGGSGKVWLESDGSGPWKGKQLVDCPSCNGSGKA